MLGAFPLKLTTRKQYHLSPLLLTLHQKSKKHHKIRKRKYKTEKKREKTIIIANDMIIYTGSTPNIYKFVE